MAVTVFPISLKHCFFVLALLAFGISSHNAWGMTVTASADGQSANNTVDGSLEPSSRWSAKGDGQWIQYDLEQMRTLNTVDIAFFNGDQQIAYFDIEIAASPDGPWDLVFSGQSSGNTIGFESFSVGGLEGRHVRIIGFGNSSNRLLKNRLILRLPIPL